MKKQCKIDAHIPTDDGSSCLCGYFVSHESNDINRKDGIYPNTYDEIGKEYDKKDKSMNRQELEKMFDGMFFYNFGNIYKEETVESKHSQCNKIKEFIFDTVIPEVLKNVLGYELQLQSGNKDHENFEKGVCFLENNIKQKAKELYNIIL